MWPFMLTGLACGARIVLYEGSPFYPSVKHYLQFIDSQKCAVHLSPVRHIDLIISLQRYGFRDESTLPIRSSRPRNQPLYSIVLQ